MSRKPIKRSKELTPLSRDHHEGLLLCWKIRNGIKNNITEERIRNYALYFFDRHLKEHFREEEEIVFAPLYEDDEMKKKALMQHMELYKLFDDLSANAIGQEEQLTNIADKLDAHIRFEERELFPYIEQKLEGEELKQIGIAINDIHREKTTLEWDDEFWLKK